MNVVVSFSSDDFVSITKIKARVYRDCAVSCMGENERHAECLTVIMHLIIREMQVKV